MNWNKAKNYLIIALAILNIFLVISIFNHNNNVSIDNIYFSKKSMADFQTMLDRKNVKITTQIPTDVYNTGTVNVEYQTINAYAYPLLFEEYDGKINVNSLKKLVINNSDILIEDTVNAENFANRFISRYLSDYTYELRNYTKENGIITFFYNPIYDGFAYEESELRFVFSPEGMKIVMIVMRPLDVSATSTNVITSVEAILKAFPSMKENTVISKIDFIYYFDTVLAEDLYKVKNARAFPCWRLITSDNELFYVPALEN
ncbi:hypothetical protein [Proteocatella sphenisci]|uniref:hypothetical protein n=1 Tax=Proteocatella sphenisci TaxID=181070 RepID=UPI00048CBCC0|nr:hypothetical protein [Proteocatella sphenisci]